MSPDDASSDRLAELRRRWEADPGSRLFLQLAEEYRRAGRHEEAREVLDKGLEAHPTQVSALVALGRTLVALARPRQAVAALEKAMAIDAANPMAQKVAATAYLDLGDRDAARRSLELYKLLNSGDPEIETLEARLEGRAASAGPPPLPPLKTAAVPSDWSPTAAWPGLPSSEAGGAVSGPAGEPSRAAGTGEATPAAPPADERTDATPTDATPTDRAPTDRAPTLAEPPKPARHAAAVEDEPFAALFAGDQRHRYLTALASEGIFAVEEEAFAAAAPAAAEPAAEPPDGGELADEEAPAVVLPALGDERPTVTLGRLYLEQGHLTEAESIFRAVLERDPQSGSAQLGLAQVRAGLAVEGEQAGGDAGVGWVFEEAEPGFGSDSFDSEGRESADQPDGDLDDAPVTAGDLEPAAPAGEPPPLGGEARVAAAGEPTVVTRPDEPAAAPHRPRASSLTARDLLAGADPQAPPRLALMRAYLNRIVTRRGRGVEGPDVS